MQNMQNYILEHVCINMHVLGFLVIYDQTLKI